MEALFQSINEVFRFIGPASDWLWDFPTNYSWYNSIPILGNFSLAVLLLLGGGLYFTVRTGFIQITHFKTGVREIVKRRNQNAGGLSALGAFCMSTAMRVGPGNIIGVTGAITTGGPGALLWMWVSAFFGMATSYMESVLAQLFKEKRGDAYVGGLPFYGKRLLKNSAIVGAGLSLLYVLYALCCLPAQSFNTITAIGSMAQIVTGNTYAPNSALYYAAAAVIVILTCVLAFSGIKKTAKFNTRIVPAMAVLYCAAVLALIVLNLNRVPLFFSEVFSGAFTPKAIFGGAFGTVLCQGVKRGLMSNEAGQGTITMAAATADVEHPAIQGCVESVGVFLDTIVICTLTGFVVVMGGLYNGANAEAFMAMDRLPRFLASVAELTPGTAVNAVSTFLMTLCFGMFAYTCVTSFISFSEIAASRISKNRGFILGIRVLCMAFIVFGLLCNMAGLDLGNLWAFSDLGNILIVFFNIPLLFLGARYVFRATHHFKQQDGTPLTHDIVGCDIPFWEERAAIKQKQQ